ncbi:hypothetical protein E8L90_17130 [Brevibacillus antibioticus]|uniref:Lipoprotein n=1 Tax=Brevibacillus antibioticus TaxID=2570228 RepID=A0A4U2Y8W6_9BACL|nr:hypothetical protein [Brevibacillus antibioticus]TKI57049.1 hypothetical protein E8L90_17130 [Brevibacillus antibioticus]
MKKTFTGVVVSILMLLLSACNNVQETTAPIEVTQEAQQLPTEIWLQMYREDSKKPQPELIKEMNNREQVEQIYTWINGGTKDQTITASTIDEIYLLRFEFMKEGQAVESQIYLYVITTDSKLYAKKVVLNAKYDFDEYDSSKKSALISEAGTEGWQELKTGVINKDVLYN